MKILHSVTLIFAVLFSSFTAQAQTDCAIVSARINLATSDVDNLYHSYNKTSLSLEALDAQANQLIKLADHSEPTVLHALRGKYITEVRQSLKSIVSALDTAAFLIESKRKDYTNLKTPARICHIESRTASLVQRVDLLLSKVKTAKGKIESQLVHLDSLFLN